MKNKLSMAVLASTLFAASPVFADAGDFLVRVRAIDIIPNTSSSAANLGASDEWTPDVDFSYFITKNIALELLADIPQETTITSSGKDIGSVKILPPTLTLQYHFIPDGTFRPYVGAGINYSRFYDVNLAGGTLTVDNSSWGAALQAGFDYGLDKNWFLNLDVKYIWMSTNVNVAATGAHVTDFDINPWVLGFGVGRKF